MGTLCIKNGTIVNSDSEQIADILIQDGKILNVSKDIKIENKNIRVIDAASKLILPGGIDPHVHFHLPTPAGFSSDDFESGTKAALAGGTTTIIDFVTPGSRSESLLKALEKRRSEAEKSLSNYAFHMSPLAWNKSVASEIEYCIKNEGIPSFKTYMAYKQSIGLDLNSIEKLMLHLAKYSGLMLVHAEDGDKIDQFTNDFLQNDKTDNIFHALSRLPEVEEKAIGDLIGLIKKTNCKTYIVHTSSGNSIKRIKQAQQNNLPVVAETCPHYLMFDDSKLKKPFYESAPYIFSPALHSKEHKELLWNGISNGIISSIGTDHCPFNLYGQKDLGLNNFTKVANGAGGIEHRLELLYTYGVLPGKISMQQMVNLVSTQPAKIFGITNKGTIDIGFDADLVIWDTDIDKKISKNSHFQNCDHNIYEGLTIKGEANQVFINGELAFSRNNAFTNTKGSFLFRSL